MIDWLKEWLMGVIVLSVLCAAADSLLPEGAGRAVGRLVCAMAMLCVMLRPVSAVKGERIVRYLREYSALVEEIQVELEQQSGVTQKTVIEQQCGTYIADKAAQIGVLCHVQVECKATDEGIWLPKRVELRGAFSDVAQSRMTQFLEEQLGVAVEDQSYFRTGEVER